MDKEKMIKALKSAVTMLSPIAVSGDAVDMMAAAKNNIRQVVAELEKQEAKPDGNS